MQFLRILQDLMCRWRSAQFRTRGTRRPFHKFVWNVEKMLYQVIISCTSKKNLSIRFMTIIAFRDFGHMNVTSTIKNYLRFLMCEPLKWCFIKFWFRAHDCHECHMTTIKTCFEIYPNVQPTTGKRKEAGSRAGVQRFAVWSNQIK